MARRSLIILKTLLMDILKEITKHIVLITILDQVSSFKEFMLEKVKLLIRVEQTELLHVNKLNEEQ